MKQSKTARRLLSASALVLALAAVWGLAFLPSSGLAAEKSASAGSALAAAYDGLLTAEELAAVEKLEAARLFSYEEPGEGSVRVRCAADDSFTVTASAYTDRFGNRWTPAEIAVVNFADETTAQVPLAEGRGSFSYDGRESFSLRVDYSCAAPLTEAVRAELDEALLLPRKLAGGIDLLRELETEVLPNVQLVQDKITMLYDLIDLGYTIQIEIHGTVMPARVNVTDPEFKEPVERLRELTGAVYEYDSSGKPVRTVGIERDLPIIALMEPGANLAGFLENGEAIRDANEELLGLLSRVLASDGLKTLRKHARERELSSELREMVDMMDTAPYEAQASMTVIRDDAQGWAALEGSAYFTDAQLLAAAAEIDAVDTSGIPEGRTVPAVPAELTIAEVAVTVAGGHEYTASVTAPTCTERGYTTHTCSRCGAGYVDSYTDALGHDYEDAATAPTCTARGYTTHICTRCGDSYIDGYTDALGHDYEDTVTAPTCTARGYTTHTCSRGDDSYTDAYTEPLGHVLVKTDRKPADAPADDPTEYYICTRCENFFVTPPAEEHVYVASVTAPTCTERGYTTYTCSHCGDSYVEDYTAPLGHDYEASTVEPTCVSRGYTAHVCRRCGDTYIDTSTYVDALGHDYDAVVTLATCTEGGYTTHTCSRCGDSYVDALVEPLGHDYEDAVTEPTCTEQGYTTHTCIRCGDSYIDGYTDALGHDCSAEVTEPTCTEGGYTTYTCVRCGISYVDDETAPLGHDYEGAVTEPTCTEGGYITYTCARCGISYTGDETAPLGHSLTKAEAIAATTAAEGRIEHFECDRCGRLFADSEGLREIVPADTVTEKLPSEEEPAYDEGWQIGAGGKWWYQYADGSYAADGWETIGGKRYHFDRAGYMQTGWLEDGGDWYYLTGSGAMAVGWAGGGGWWYYFDADGVMQTGWIRDGDAWYYCGDSGLMQIGWQKLGGEWYYFRADGRMATGWAGGGGWWYFFDRGGAMQTGWVWDGSHWYYCDDSGLMRIGWQEIGGKRYYLQPSGVMTTGWQGIDGEWYRFGSSGAMQTGWVLADGSWYYLDDDTGAMRTGWLQLGDTWYWLHSSGAMAADETIGGCTFDSTGAWIP